MRRHKLQRSESSNDGESCGFQGGQRRHAVGRRPRNGRASWVAAVLRPRASVAVTEGEANAQTEKESGTDSKPDKDQ